MNIYRDNKTRSLINLFLNTPRGFTGSCLDTTDYVTSKTKRLSNSHQKHLALVGAAALGFSLTTAAFSGASYIVGKRQ